MNIGIVGCGQVGSRRAAGIGGEHRLVAACDGDLARARRLTRASGAYVTDDYAALVGLKDVELVIVATTNHMLAPVTLAAVRRGKHVLVEKPCAVRSSEMAEIIEAAEASGVQVKAGFNHRHHPALLKARQIADEQDVGKLMFIRGRYGHGGRPGYDREWRANPSLSGGGEALDQGVHLIDLSRWFMGDFERVEGFAATYYWDMPVDDNAFFALRTADGRAAWLQASCTEWKNMFSFEIYFERAKLMVDGLGGSYGVERLSHYRMLPQMGPPETVIYEYPMPDSSWADELALMIREIQAGKPVSMGNVRDAYEALRIVEQIYGRSTQ